VKIQFDGKTCTSTNTITISFLRFNSTGGTELAINTVPINSSDYTTFTRNLQVYPGETIYMQGAIGVADVWAAFKNIAIYGASTTPSTGIAYST